MTRYLNPDSTINFGLVRDMRLGPVDGPRSGAEAGSVLPSTGHRAPEKRFGQLPGYQQVMESRNSCSSSASSKGRGESLVTRCCGIVPATRLGTSSGP
jgi:hypothetical protein